MLKRTTKTTAEKVVTNRRVEPDSKFSLNYDFVEPSTNFADYTWLIYGEKGIGKTSLCSHFPEAIFLMFEPGGKALRIRTNYINTWGDFKKAIDFLSEDESMQTVIVDTVDVCYNRCFEHVCKFGFGGIKHPQELDKWAKSQAWDAIKKEFSNEMSRLMNIGKGVVLTSHSKLLEVTPVRGKSYNVMTPTMGGQAADFCEAAIDIVGAYMYNDGTERRLQIRGSDFVTAKCRPELNMLTPNGKQVFSIPMGESSKESYANILNAWDNKQKDPGYLNGEDEEDEKDEEEIEEEEEE